MSAIRDNMVRLAVVAGMTLCVIGLTKLTQTRPSPPRVEPAQEDNTLTAMADAWSGEINYAPAYAALNPYRAETGRRSDTPFDPYDDYWGLPRSEGHRAVAAYCAACHSLQIVMQQQQTRGGWDYLLTWMVEKQGMAAPPPEMREELLDYLTREFGANPE